MPATISAEISSPRQAEKIHRILEKAQLVDACGEVCFEKLKSLSSMDFQAALKRLNGIIQAIPIAERKINQPVAVRVSAGGVDQGVEYQPPHPDHKAELISDLIEHARACKDRRECGALLYYGIQAIHPWPDGNGRTGRALFHLIQNDKLTGESFAATLHHESESDQAARKAFESQLKAPERIFAMVRYSQALDLAAELGLDTRFNRTYDENFVNNEFPETPLLSAGARERLRIATEDRAFCSSVHLALMSYAKHLGKMDCVQIQDLKADGSLIRKDNSFLRIDSTKLLASMSDSEAEVFINKVFDYRKEMVKTLMSAFSKPQEFTVNGRAFRTGLSAKALFRADSLYNNCLPKVKAV